MKLCLPISILLAVLSLGILSACSADNEDEEWNVLTYSNVTVKDFKLGKNDSVLANLDTVFFSIDLNRGRIFNADSLPKGTRIDRLTVSITLPEVSRAMIYFTGDKGLRDSVNYTKSSTDSINFANGPVTLSLTSADGLVSRDYLISVNVHRQNPDSLAWGSTALRSLPTGLTLPVRSRTVEMDGMYHCLTVSATGEADMASTDNLQGLWATSSVTLPEGADVNSLSAADHKLFILNAQGRLFSSADLGASWTDTGVDMAYIYGAYGSELLGASRRADGSYVTLSYPSATDPSTATPLPERCPVRGTSSLLIYTSEWSSKPTAIFTGGADASNRLSGSSWAYDGSQWADISLAPGLPRRGMVVVPYTGFRSNQYWITREYDVLLAFGGASERGVNDNELWITFDRGIHWVRGGVSLQPSPELPALSLASGFVQRQTLSTAIDRSAEDWIFCPEAPLPSRASIDFSWESPYIYIVGGYTDASRLNPAIWRGAINRLTYKPLF